MIKSAQLWPLGINTVQLVTTLIQVMLLSLSLQNSNAKCANQAITVPQFKTRLPQELLTTIALNSNVNWVMFVLKEWITPSRNLALQVPSITHRVITPL
jgi:hypothetical protein